MSNILRLAAKHMRAGGATSPDGMTPEDYDALADRCEASDMSVTAAMSTGGIRFTVREASPGTVIRLSADEGAALRAVFVDAEGHDIGEATMKDADGVEIKGRVIVTREVQR